MRKVVLLGQAACGLVFFVGIVLSAAAGSFSVSPVRATLSSTQSVVALTVRNGGSDPTVVQLETVRWSQRDGQDVYEPTREILATPPIFTVPAGGSQVVRVGLRRAPDANREITYRLFLREVPPPARPGFQGLQVALRIGVPIFVLPRAPAKPVLRWHASRTTDGMLQIALSNAGNAHIQIGNLRISSSAGEALAAQQMAAYVLEGQSRSWLVGNVHAPSSGTLVHLSAQTDAGDVQEEVVVE